MTPRDAVLDENSGIASQQISDTTRVRWQRNCARNCAGSGSDSSLNQRPIREMPASVFSTLHVGLVWRSPQKVATNQKVGSSNLSGLRHWELRPDSGLKVECYGSTKPEIGAVAASRRKIFSEGAAAGAGAPDTQDAAQTSCGEAGGVARSGEAAFRAALL
jgi:hypothetical protein